MKNKLCKETTAMRIITDSAADFTPEELAARDITCAIGPSIAPHIGHDAYGLVFVEGE